MGKHYTEEYKMKVLKDYFSGKYGGRDQVAKKYKLNSGTISNWVQKFKKQGDLNNDVHKARGRRKEENIDYKEKYEILKNYQTFLKAQRKRK